MNQELPDVQAGFRKGRGTREQIANIRWIIEKVRAFQKNIYFCFIDYAFDCVDHNKLWEILKEMKIPDHLTCLEKSVFLYTETSVQNLYTEKSVCSQEERVRTRYGTMDWFQTGKGLSQGCIFHPAYLTYMQATPCEMPGCMKYKVESRLPGEISTISDTQMTPPLWQKEKKNQRAS